MQEGETPRCYHGFTAATATVAEIRDFFSTIAAELNQLPIISDVEEIQAFLHTESAGMAVFDQGPCRLVK
jgi:hypothetical protein